MLDNLNYQDKKTLISLAKQSIEYGLNNNGERMIIALEKYSELLQQQQAAFVTIEKFKQLRGCIGTLVARQALVLEVVESAFNAAFFDQRFPKVTNNEFPDLKVHIAILSKPTAIKFSSEQDLVSQIKPNIDGLILKVGNTNGTFLPSVWEQLPDPQEFLNHLKNKAGLASDYWSDKVQVFRYETFSIAEE